MMCMRDDFRCLIKFIPNFLVVVSYVSHHHIDLFQFFMIILNYYYLNTCTIPSLHK
jgi:hypothetical protein